MSILVVGSVAFDSIRTPYGHEDEILGGSGTYFSLAASYFAPVSLVAVVGEDFPDEHMEFFRRKGIDVSGLQRQAGRTFRWRGEYGHDMNVARTLETQLNVFASFSPRMRPEHAALELLFLGNIDPDLQRVVLGQMRRPRMVACDTMNYWIENKPESLLQTLALVDLLVINESETRQLAGETNLIKASRRILSFGPKMIVVKRGEYGALMVGPKTLFATPALPLEEVVDPTGAGDSFAGGMMGYLAASGSQNDSVLRRAILYGCVMASFDVGQFGPRGLVNLSFTEIEARCREFRRVTHVDEA